MRGGRRDYATSCCAATPTVFRLERGPVGTQAETERRFGKDIKAGPKRSAANAEHGARQCRARAPPNAGARRAAQNAGARRRQTPSVVIWTECRRRCRQLIARLQAQQAAGQRAGF